MKPRIIRWGPIYCCFAGPGPAGFGDTPALAYSDWAVRFVLAASPPRHGVPA